MPLNCNLLLQNLTDAIFLLDTEGFIYYANPAAVSFFLYTENDFLNQPFSFLYNKDSIKAEYELNQAAKKGKFISEGWRIKKDGSRFWGELTISAVYSENRSLEGYCCFLRDTTEKKQNELELRENEERFRLLVEGVEDYAIFMMDTTGHIMTWNEGAKRIKGYLPDEIIGKHFSIFYTSTDLETKKPERELEIVLETGRYEEEGWRIKKNGSVFWANILITAVYNEQNKIIGLSKVTRDLTERKASEELMRQSEERYRSLVQQVTDYGIFMMDEKGKIVSWNEGAKRINGYTATEIIGKYFSIFYPQEDIINGKPAMELRVARTEGKYEEEGWRIRKDGSRFWANVVITAVYNAAGSLIGFSKVTRDLTERKEYEKALRDSYERYRKLTGELRVINSQLSYTNSELEQFTSIVSHDLQEPVRTIKSFLQLIDIKLSEGQLDELQTYIGKSIAAANRMRELIQNLLHYSQLSRGEMAMEKINVPELVQQVLQNLRTSLEQSGAEVRLKMDVDVVYGDPVQLAQLIQNLLSNALKFTNSEHPKIEVRSSQENGAVKFSVSDNGIGIAESDVPKVFEIFRRLHTKKTYPGTGIGLAICKKIIDRHGGRIWLESEVGKGTTFYFTINEEKEETIKIS